MTEFNFTPPELAEEAPLDRTHALVGIAESDDRQIRAVITQDGHLHELEFAPELLTSRATRDSHQFARARGTDQSDRECRDG